MDNAHTRLLGTMFLALILNTGINFFTHDVYIVSLDLMEIFKISFITAMRVLIIAMVLLAIQYLRKQKLKNE